MLARRAIPDPLWRLTLARVPFLAERSAQDLDELRRLASLFLDEKEFTGGGGLVVGGGADRPRVPIALRLERLVVALGRLQPPVGNFLRLSLQLLPGERVL